jgi:hypothetical protein
MKIWPLTRGVTNVRGLPNNPDAGTIAPYRIPLAGNSHSPHGGIPCCGLLSAGNSVKHRLHWRVGIRRRPAGYRRGFPDAPRRTRRAPFDMAPTRSGQWKSSGSKARNPATNSQGERRAGATLQQACTDLHRSATPRERSFRLSTAANADAHRGSKPTGSADFPQVPQRRPHRQSPDGPRRTVCSRRLMTAHFTVAVPRERVKVRLGVLTLQTLAEDTDTCRTKTPDFSGHTPRGSLPPE